MKVDRVLEKELIAKSAKGWSARRISTWLRTERGITVSAQALNARFRQTRLERGEVAKAVTREILVPQLTDDLGVLSAEKDRAVRLVERLWAQVQQRLDEQERAKTAAEKTAAAFAVRDAVEIHLKAQDRVGKFVDLKLHYAGADSDDEGDAEVAEAGDRIRSRLAVLAANSPKGS